MTRKIIAIFSSVLLLAGSVAPVFADSTITISGNGSDSVNTTNVSVTQTTQVTQTNSANITNNVSSSSNSGDNSASHNTGGDVTVDTGNAKTQVSVANTANSNVANVSNCNCGAGDVNVSVTGNGTDSKNVANTEVSNQVQLVQANVSNIDNDVHNATSNTGKNDADHNTGGSVSVGTGNATTIVGLTTLANQNVAQVGGTTGGVSGNGASVIISGNGSDSYNKVNLGLTDWVTLAQTNSADVNNHVNAKSNTGDNKAYGNTGGSLFGGDVTVETGNAMTDVSADTAVNFNEAAVGCDCLVGVTAKISGNGASDGWWWDNTSNTINASLTNGQVIAQANGGEGIDNNLYGNSATGDNHAAANTGEATDPSIMTGDSTSMTEVNNQGNSNVFGSVDHLFPWDWNRSNTNVTLTFNLQQLLAALGL